MMKNHRGFTLIELVVVLAVIAIMTVIATTNYRLWLRHSSAVGFQRELLSRINEARTRSLGATLQHRVLIDLGGETVTLQRGNSGTGTTSWADINPRVEGKLGAAVETIIWPNGSPSDNSVSAGTFAFIFNPDGQVLTQRDPTDASTISPLTQADIRLTADSAADHATIRVFGWTSKARLLNGWI